MRVGTLPSAEWTACVWSDGRQVTSLLGWPHVAGDEAPPHLFFAGLREVGRDVEAAQFLGLALPRLEAVAWAERVVAASPIFDPADRRAMATVADWLREPSDGNRRRAGASAEQIGEASPARMCATAVFLSGGSIAPVREPAISSPRHATGLLAGGAVLATCFTRDEPDRALDAALVLGAAIAARTMDAIA